MELILIPGLWLDASSWDEVAPALEQAGHRTRALTLPGMESKDADRSEITLRDHVDSWPLGQGKVINDQLPADNGEVPLPDWSLFDDEDLVDLDDELRAAFRERAIAAPVHVARDPQHLSDERRYDVPITIIACEVSSAMLQEWMAQAEPALQELAKIRDVEYIDVPTGHWPQFTRPMELARAILTSVDS